MSGERGPDLGGRVSSEQVAPRLCRQPEALRSNHPAHHEPRLEPLAQVCKQGDLGLILGPTV